MGVVDGVLLLVDVASHRRTRVLLQVLLVGLATSLVALIVNPTLRAR